MIRVTRQGENIAPSWFIRELRLIEPEFYPFWDPQAERWLIVRAAPSDVFRRNYIVEYCVSKGKDYTPLDNRTLFELKRILYEKNRLREMDEHLEDMREEDEALQAMSDREWQGLKREFMKKLYKFSHEKTFI